MFGLGCECAERTYQSKWSWDECLQFLSRTNAYDTLEYRFENEAQLYIVFRRSLVRFFCGNFNSKYDLIRRDCDAGARFTVRYDETPFGSCLTDKWLDEFFKTKLDAALV